LERNRTVIAGYGQLPVDVEEELVTRFLPGAIITPTIAYGKGIKNFDLQETLGDSLPSGKGADDWTRFVLE
jgi:hypothetical protein